MVPPAAGSFAISRLLVAACDTSDPSLPDIGPSAPYTPKPKPKHLPMDTVVVPGEKPPRVRQRRRPRLALWPDSSTAVGCT